LRSVDLLKVHGCGKSEGRIPKPEGNPNDELPKSEASSQEGMQGKDEIEIGALPIGQDNEE